MGETIAGLGEDHRSAGESGEMEGIVTHPAADVDPFEPALSGGIAQHMAPVLVEGACRQSPELLERQHDLLLGGNRLELLTNGIDHPIEIGVAAGPQVEVE
ncbi:hypothetical protein [Rhodococcus koreensis]